MTLQTIGIIIGSIIGLVVLALAVVIGMFIYYQNGHDAVWYRGDKLKK